MRNCHEGYSEGAVIREKGIKDKTVMKNTLSLDDAEIYAQEVQKSTLQIECIENRIIP